MKLSIPQAPTQFSQPLTCSCQVTFTMRLDVKKKLLLMVISKPFSDVCHFDLVGVRVLIHQADHKN